VFGGMASISHHGGEGSEKKCHPCGYQREVEGRGVLVLVSHSIHMRGIWDSRNKGVMREARSGREVRGWGGRHRL